MNYSSIIKTKILSNLSVEPETAVSELYAFMLFNATLVIKGRGEINLSFSSPNAAQIRRIHTLIKEVFGYRVNLSVSEISSFGEKKLYNAFVNDTRTAVEILMFFELMDVTGTINLKNDIIKTFISGAQNQRAFLTAAFLSCGYVNDPKKSYYMQFTFQHKQIAQRFCEIIASYNIFPKTREKNNDIIVYVRKASEVNDLCVLCSATSVSFDINDALIVKQMKNDARRKVNCDTANSDKTTEVSLRTCEAIDKLIRNSILSTLPDYLIKTAHIRLENPEMSLSEMCGQFDPPLKKSTLNNRLKRLTDIAEHTVEKEEYIIESREENN